MALLDDDAVSAALADLPEWSGDMAAITRTVEVSDFLVGIGIVDAVAQAAEVADHHPDIDIRWRTLTFTLSTHSEGGVTQQDVDLARTIDDLATGH